MKRARTAWVTLAGLAGMAGAAIAGEVATVSVIGSVQIVSEDKVQMLLRLAPLEIPSDAMVESAYLHIPAPSTYPSEIVTLQVNPITAAWAGGVVDWSFLERVEGGNVQLDLYARTRVGSDRRPEEIVLDVSTIIAAAHGGLNVSGLCVSVAPFEGDGIRTADASLMDRLGQARIDIRYREPFAGPPRPRGER